MRISHRRIEYVLIPLLLAACSKQLAPPPAAAPAVPAGVDLTAINTKINPCQDFYQYACGNWIANNPIPADESGWSNLQKLYEQNLDELHKILDAAGAGAGSQDAVTQEVGDYYGACMNQAAIDATGLQPLQNELAAIAAIKSKEQLAPEIARLQINGADVLFGFGSDQDFKNANAEIAEVAQGGLGLPDRDYYTKTDAKSVTLRRQYQAHVQKMFELLGDPAGKAAAEAATVIRLETALARASLTNVAQRDPNAVYHKMSAAQFQALAPAFDWRAFFAATDAPGFQALNVAEPGFFRALNDQLRAVPLGDWKTYLRWHLVHQAAPALSQPFVDANFAFYGAILTGQKEQKPRWKRCVASTDTHLGEALGQLYVKAEFSPAAKAHMRQLVGNLEAALGKDITSLSWMSSATKQQALTKLHAIVNKIGYPDQWRDYSSIPIGRGNYYADLAAANAFESHRQLNKIGKPVDRGEWQMTPPTVDAYYNPLWNEIVFPAGILQVPFYGDGRDPAVNYGGIGVVMGHELTHGFDDQGRQFDAQGDLRDWWTPADAKAFQQRAACIVKEYSGFSPAPGVHLNGRLELGEDTADNGGARIAYAAMESALAGRPDALIAGYDRAQRFFIGFGQVLCQSVHPQLAALYANTNPHAFVRFRVTGVVQNMPEFAQAFHCGPNDPMNAGAKACRVW